MDLGQCDSLGDRSIMTLIHASSVFLINRPMMYAAGLKAMTHQPTQLLSLVGLGPVGVCVIGLQLDLFLHSSLIPDYLVGSRPP